MRELILTLVALAMLGYIIYDNEYLDAKAEAEVLEIVEELDATREENKILQKRLAELTRSSNAPVGTVTTTTTSKPSTSEPREMTRSEKSAERSRILADLQRQYNDKLAAWRRHENLLTGKMAEWREKKTKPSETGWSFRTRSAGRGSEPVTPIWQNNWRTTIPRLPTQNGK